MCAEKSAVIVGAGIAGLTTAYALARDGWQVEIFEQAHKLEPVGAGIQLGPNATRLLDRNGLLDAVRAYSVETESLLVRAGLDGRTLSGMQHGAFASARWGAPFHVIHRGDLQSVLLDALDDLNGVTLHLGQRLESVMQRDGRVYATFLKYSEERIAEAPLLIGADGVWSRVRGHIGLPGPTTFSGCVAWRTVVPASAVSDHARLNRSNLWLGPDAHVVHYPIRCGELVNIVAVIEDSWREKGWSESGDVGWINRRFRDWHPDLAGLIGSAHNWLRWSLFDRAPEWKWVRDNAVLMGDAAHPMLPFLAQGAAQAIEDAFVLAACLRDAPTQKDALDRYQTLRISRAARVQKSSHRQMRIYHAAGPLAYARNFALGALGETGMAARYDWLYSGPTV